MTDKEKNKIADILLDFYDEYHSNEINRPMIPSIYAGKIIDSLQEEPAYCTGIGEPKEESGVLGEMIKEMKEDPKPKFEVGSKIRVKPFSKGQFGIILDEWPRKIVDITGGYYILDDNRAYKIKHQDNWEVVEEPKDYRKDLDEEPVSEDIWKISKQYALRQVFASTDTKMTEQAYFALNLFSGHELAVAHKDGMLAMKQQMMKKAVNGIVCKNIHNELRVHSETIPDNHPSGVKFGDDVRLIIIKEE